MRHSFLLPVLAVAAISQAATLPYQGILTDAKGNPVKDSTYALNLSLYGQSAAGTALWTESQTVTTKKGLFSLNLGSVTAIANATILRDSLFLGLTVGGTELTPRTRFGAAPWAVRAVRADTAAFALNAGAVGDLNTTLANTRDTLKQTRDSVSALKSRVSKIETDLASILTVLKGVKRTGNELFFDSVNVNIRNGLGSTGTMNALGNLVVGYNELRTSGNVRTGSHAVVLGAQQNWSSYGNLVTGAGNTASGIHAVAHGFTNIASGPYATVSAGRYDTASAAYSSVSGGAYNGANGTDASILGGYANSVSGSHSTIAGGNLNVVSGDNSAILSGNRNKVTAHWASISGGGSNTASANGTSILGGGNNTADVGSDASTIIGGQNVTATTNYQVLP